VRAQLAAVTVFLLGAATLVAGCGGDPVTAQYVFNSSDSPINVDTPELRELKTQAGIEPCPNTSAPASVASHALPDITLPCLGGGRAVNIARLRGPLVLNLWAQWCAPCRQETKVLAQVATEYRGKVQVIGVDWQDTKPDWALAMLHASNATYPQLADPEAATRAPLQIRGMPTTVFVARDGSIAYVNSGPFDSAGDLRQAIEEHLGVAAPRAGT
jgi:cytochrome c biogenesis protein CcmG, thiol:disulfide interchange protein DsbE